MIPARQPLAASLLAESLDGRLEGPDSSVTNLAVPGRHDASSVVVIAGAAVSPIVPEPALAVVPLDYPTDLGFAIVRVRDTRTALAKLTEIFDDRPAPPAGVARDALVAAGARLGEGVRVASGAVIGAGVEIGAGTIIGAGCVIAEAVTVGEGCHLHPRVTLLDGVELGARVTVQSGAVIGSDGFGYAITARGAVKIRHLGGVRLEDDVEIGAGTCIDRGTLGDTIIGARTKIDNLCQIAHNVRIGSDCLIAGQSGIAGSTVLGDRVILAGGAGVADHLTIGDGAVIGPRAAVLKDVPAGERWLGSPAQPYRRFARQSYLLGRLERIWAFVKSRSDGDDR